MMRRRYEWKRLWWSSFFAGGLIFGARARSSGEVIRLIDPFLAFFGALLSKSSNPKVGLGLGLLTNLPIRLRQ
jgi:hypothetical protein